MGSPLLFSYGAWTSSRTFRVMPENASVPPTSILPSGTTSVRFARSFSVTTDEMVGPV